MELRLKSRLDIILSFGTMKLLGMTENKITKDKSGENVLI